MPSAEHTRVADLIRAFGIAEKTGTPVEEQRMAYEAAGAAYPVDEQVEVLPLDLSPGGLSGEWIAAPGAEPERAVLYFHGGGYVIGSCGTHRELAARLSAACRSRVLLPAYRLAPENPFPAAIDDALACYRFLSDAGAEPSSTVVAGDSAGGGLTLALLLCLKDGGEPLPAAAACLSPWVDLSLSGESLDSRAAQDPVVSRSNLTEMAEYYLSGHDPTDPLASPLFGELAGLPPLLVQVGTAEVLLDDARRIVARALDAGVEATLEEYPDLIHVFQAFAAQAPEAEAALASVGRFVDKHLA